MAYTVLFSFPRHTLHYFDEGQYAVVVKKFYKNLLGLYVEIATRTRIWLSGGRRSKRWRKMPDCIKSSFMGKLPGKRRKKKQIYISDFVAVFGRFPEGWAQEELESANERKLLLLLKSSYLRRRTGR